MRRVKWRQCADCTFDFLFYGSLHNVGCTYYSSFSFSLVHVVIICYPAILVILLEIGSKTFPIVNHSSQTGWFSVLASHISSRRFRYVRHPYAYAGLFVEAFPPLRSLIRFVSSSRPFIILSHHPSVYKQPQS